MTHSLAMSEVSRRVPLDALKAQNDPLSVRLHRYLIEAASQPHEWGVSDCCTFAADWVVECGYPDPMARWRGKYDTQQGAMSLIRDNGGLSMLWMLGMLDVGLPEPDAPRIGDVGVVEAMTVEGPQQVGAIFGGKRWSMLSPNGLFCASVPAVMIWRV